jgi:DNA-binding phage protein
MAKQHITYYAIAKKAGLRHQVVAGVLNGSENVEIKTLLKVAQGLGKKLIVKFA